MNKAKTRPRILLVNRSIVVNDQGKILLIQRSADDTFDPNLWEFPGGKLDEGQDVSDALEREVLEETGLLILPTNRVTYFESTLLVTGKYAGLPYVVLVGISKVMGGEVQLSAEHQDFAWETPKEALRYNITSVTHKALLALDKILA